MALSSGKMKTAILGGVAALTLAGAVVTAPTPAEAGWRGHRVHYWHGGYRPYWGHRYYHRGWGGGGAVAAGLIGGLALGAIAANSYYPYGGYGYYPAAYQPVYYGGYGGCWTERRVRFTPWGERIVRRVQVCG